MTLPAGTAISGMYRTAALDVATRAVGLVVGAGAGILTARILVEYAGARAFGLIALLASLPQLLTFFDWGAGTSVTNAVIRYGADACETRRAIFSAVRLVILANASLLLLVAALWRAGLIPSLLGAARVGGVSSGALVFSLLTLLSVSTIFGLGTRVLIGLGKTRRSLHLQAATGPLALLCTAGTVHLGVRSGWLALAMPLAVTIVNYLTWRVAAREAPALTAAVRDVFAKPARALAWPEATVSALLISVALPIALQSDRLVLSHLSAPSLGPYALVAQAYLPLWALGAAAGLSLWRNMRGLTSMTQFWATVIAFAGVGALLGICNLLVGPVLAQLIASGSITVSATAWQAASLLLFVQAAHLPAAMLLTDASGLRFQAKCVTIMLATNLILSIILAPRLQEAGPLLASALAIVACQSIPALMYSARRLQSTVESRP